MDTQNTPVHLICGTRDSLSDYALPTSVDVECVHATFLSIPYFMIQGEVGQMLRWVCVYCIRLGTFPRLSGFCLYLVQAITAGIGHVRYPS